MKKSTIHNNETRPMIRKPQNHLVRGINRRHTRRQFHLNGFETKYFGGLLRKEPETSFWICVVISASEHETVRPFHGCSFYYHRRKVPLRCILSIRNLFHSSFAPIPRLIFEASFLIEENVRRPISRRYFSMKKAELLDRGYTVFELFADSSRLSSSVLNVLEHLASIVVEPLQTMFRLIMSMFPGKTL